MSLLDAFQKLIIEHGSAVIQEKQITLFKDQLTIADRENAKLKIEITNLQSKLQSLQAENRQLQEENDQLKRMIQDYEQPSHGILLDQPKIDILKVLFKKAKLTVEQIAQAINSEIETAKFHLEELKNQNMIRMSIQAVSPYKRITVWSLDQQGRRYLIEHQLTS